MKSSRAKDLKQKVLEALFSEAAIAAEREKLLIDPRFLREYKKAKKQYNNPR